MPHKCPIVRKEYAKKWREKNKERIKEQSKKYYQENRERKKEYGRVYSKKWYEKNKEYKKEYYKNYYQENKEHLRECGKKKYEEKKEYILEYGRKKYHENPEASAIRQIKLRYDLIKDDFFKMFEDQEGKCLCCGVHLYNDTILNNKKELEEKGVPYRKLHIDHDHSYNLPGKTYSGNKESVRGMLCDDCNKSYDPLNPESDWYIYCKKEGRKRKEIITQMRKMKYASNFN